MMQQYLEVKATCGDAILMFRLGDFYEMFQEDARIASQILDLTLTKKHIGGGQTVPLAGIPYHALNNYLFKLTRAGYRVAVCEQTEDPKQTKKLVKREVVRTVTPGTLLEAEGLEGSENNFLVAIHQGGLQGYGLAAIDISTGEFRATAVQTGRDGGPIEDHELLGEIAKLGPSEILIADDDPNTRRVLHDFIRRYQPVLTEVPAGTFNTPEDLLTVSKDGEEPALHAREIPLARKAAGAILAYLQATQRSESMHVPEVQLYRPAQFMGLDAATERNLELVSNARDGSKRGTLFAILDQTRTAMGARCLRNWILRPLLDPQAIQARQTAIGTLVSNPTPTGQISEILREVRDVERLLSRVVYNRANPRDLKALAVSLSALPGLNRVLASFRDAVEGTPSDWFQPVDEIEDLRNHLETALVEEPPAVSRDGGIFRVGYNSELDEIRAISSGGKDWILQLQARERERTGIPSLKVGYNKVFGYYLEVTKAHAEKVPEDYIRKQTLVQAERYITPELKEYESKVLTAQDRGNDLEQELFNTLVADIASESGRLKEIADRLGQLDTLVSLATVAAERGYVCPVVDRGELIEIEAGRHPTLECSAAVEHFVPNDVSLDHSKQQVLLITGPNMGGKSTFLRQTALLVLMSQMGSWIPARKARVGLVDRIFTRVGASDNLFEGQSTFMVEMTETAHILHHATAQSLVILDEIGRGTATYDGISLAWAIVECLARVGRCGVRTLFATHYHEMAELEQQFEKVANYHAMVAEQDGRITLLYQIAPGASDHSYGLHVAELAGVPKSVTRRASRILRDLESGAFHQRREADQQPVTQLSLFTLFEEPLRQALLEIKPEELSPMEALAVLDELVRQAQRDPSV